VLREPPQKLQELEEKLASLQQEEASRVQRRVRHEVAQIWFTTQLALAAICVALLLWRWEAAAVWAGLLLFSYKLPEESSPRRMLRVFWAAGMVYVKVKLLRWRLWSASLEGKDAVAEWNSLHEVLGCFFYLQTVELRGFWIKLGQQLSVNIMLPPQYVKELSKLQDKIPSMPLSTVLAIVKAEFGEAAARIIIDPDLPPLGTASIAQVHKATWQPVPGGPTRGIVVKVQHQGVDSMFRQDLRAAAILARILAWFDPEGVPDLRPLIKTLRKVALDELDFRLEATAQMRAADAVKESGADVMVPRVVPALVRRRALGMDYVDGEQLVTAGKRLPQADLDRLIAALVDHFGVQFAVDGHFHADPHPGNLLVERSTGQLVVLDWGMCVTLPDGAAQAYAQLFVACATSNIWLLIQALESIGVSFKEGDSFEPLVILHALRFVLRDSKPVGIAVGELKSMIHAGDDLGKTGPDRYKKSPMDVSSAGKCCTLESRLNFSSWCQASWALHIPSSRLFSGALT